MSDYSGQVIKGYELRDLIGKGGLGAVYRAYQSVVDREVAFKVILPQHANHPDFIRRFEVEAQLVAQLEHFHIVPLYDFWRGPSGACLVMRYLRGGSLRDLLDRQGPLEPDTVARLLDQIAAALSVAHRHQVVHRDLKPENILLDEEGNAYLTDFGIAKSLGTDSPQLTQGEILVGSPAYLTPEQINGEPVSPQTDIYSLGIVVFELLTGEPLFNGETITVLFRQHLIDSPPSVRSLRPDLPTAIDGVIQRATEKDPDKRFDDALSMAAAFRAAITDGQAVVKEDLNDTLIGDPGQIVTAAASRPVVPVTMLTVQNPYKGLRAFSEADSSDFFGREELVEKLLAHLAGEEETARFLALVGPSGIGKSSVIKAGVIPALRRGALMDADNTYIVEMVPGEHPFDELEIALLRIATNPGINLMEQLRRDSRGLIRTVRLAIPDDDSELILFIDQFEELFTLVEDEPTRAQFLDTLVAAIGETRSRLRVVISLRADFYDRPLLYPEFGELFRQSTAIVMPLTPEELERAIVEPAARMGVKPEAGLVATIIDDVGDQPGALPLLQYALTELFERREEDRVTKAAYQASGGVMGALARRADELYTALDDDGREAARQLFLRLVTLGEGAEDTRRRVHVSELVAVDGDRQALNELLERFSRYRLLTLDHDPNTREPTAEVAHEALLRQWGQLRLWLEQSREDLHVHRRLTAAATEWREAAHDTSYLARGMRLDQFQAWAGSTNLALNELEMSYLETSLADRAARRAEEETRKAYEVKIARRAQNFQRASITLAVMVVLALIMIVIAARAAGEAQTQSSIAQTNEAQARAVEATVAWQATYFALEQGQVATLAAGGVIVPAAPTQAPQDFVATLTQVAALAGQEPVIQPFDRVEMVQVPAGCFLMGSIFAQDEQPTHTVCFEAPFWIDRYEVTRAQYADCVLAEVCTEPPSTMASFSDAQPVNAVTWDQADAYCQWRDARLPTEAEWEYAARGPLSMVYPWGNTFVADHAAHFDNASETAEVGSFSPAGDSWVGAADMSGNVWEWVADWYSPYSDNAQVEPVGPESGEQRVMRGGAYNSSADLLRVSNRNALDPTEGLVNIGFRCAREG